MGLRITTGVTNVQLVNALEGWTILPEEIGTIKGFLEETRQRGVHTEWFKGEHCCDSQECIKLDSDLNCFELCFGKLRKYIHSKTSGVNCVIL